MIRFINIDNNRVYNGSMPYVHWFEGQQSVDLIYTQRLCVLSDTETIHVSLPENDIFHILDVSRIGRDEVVMNQVTYQDITKMYRFELDDTGVPYQGYFVHMLYFTGCSSSALEARETFYIDNQPFTIGADFHPEREELKINLANFGIEIPESVQRAIYPSNVHEEAKDNILLNRKYKELLMDYINILGNKGSYESLLNSLHWFEYGDLLKIKEFWKHREWEKTIYNDQEFTQILSESAKNLLVNFSKTTYMGLYLAMQREKKQLNVDQDGDVVYDQETYVVDSRFDVMVNARTEPSLPSRLVSRGEHRKDTLLQHGMSGSFVADHTDPHTIETGDPENPEELLPGADWRRSSDALAEYNRFIAEPIPALEKALYIWGRTDLAIKMALLGHFYETYFMPVHLDLIHSTIEDIVYTNAIKTVPSGYMSRTDHVESLHNVLCNVQDDQQFLLGDVTVQADNKTPFHVHWTNGEVKTLSTKAPSSYGYGYGYEYYSDTSQVGEYEYELDETPTYDNHTIIGVDQALERSIDNDDELQTWAVNRYHGTGVVIPMDFTIRASERTVIDGEVVSQDVIYNTVLSIDDGEGKWPVFTFHNLYAPNENNEIHIKFNLLCTKDAEYDLRVQFYSTNGQTYVKRVKFVTLDTRRVGLTVYKIIPSKTPPGPDAGNYMFSHYLLPEVQQYYTQYIPQSENDPLIDGLLQKQYLAIKRPTPKPRNAGKQTLKGAQLNHLLVLKGRIGVPSNPDEPERDLMNILREKYPALKSYLIANYIGWTDSTDNNTNMDRTHFYERRKIWESGGTIQMGSIRFYVFVSREFNFVPDEKILSQLRSIGEYQDQVPVVNSGMGRKASGKKPIQNPNYSPVTKKQRIIYRDEYIYIPQNHYLSPMNGDTLSGYTVARNETLCVVPDIKFLKYIKDYEWVFHNASTGEDINLNSIKEPIIAPTERKPLSAGYYDITFRYRLSKDYDPETRINPIHEVSLKSAFIQSDK